MVLWTMTVRGVILRFGVIIMSCFINKWCRQAFGSAVSRFLGRLCVGTICVFVIYKDERSHVLVRRLQYTSHRKKGEILSGRGIKEDCSRTIGITGARGANYTLYYDCNELVKRNNLTNIPLYSASLYPTKIKYEQRICSRTT